MPGGDRTGPQGMGPMSGRGMGYCSGNVIKNSENNVDAGGFGRGFGRGRGGRGQGQGRRRGGWRNWFPTFNNDTTSTSTGTADELTRLKDQAGQLETSLNAIRRRIDQLEETNNKG